MASKYTNEDITVLDDLEHMRLRRGMYIGEADNPKQLISEIIDNALDEVQEGYSDELIVTVNTKDNIYTVRDFGRGIPHGKKKLDDGTEKEIIEVLLTKAHSGGKFNTENYSTSAGLNGLGLTITNALSNFINITSYRNGKFVKGICYGTNNVELTYGDSKEKTGTEVIFQPNPKYFTDKKIPIDFIFERCKIATALGYKSRLIIDGVEKRISSSIYDLIREESTSISTYVNIPPIEVVSSAKEKLKVAIRYTSDTRDKYFGFTNLLSNYLGGTHVQELEKSVEDAWQIFLNSHKKLKPEIELKASDFVVGMRGVCAVFISHPEFSSQTKEKLVVNKKYFEELMALFKKKFVKYLDDNTTVAQQLIKRFEEYRRAQNALLSRKEIGSLIKINTDSENSIRRRSVVSKLVECTSKKRENTELFIAEGDSALAPFLFTRNKETQAVIPLRGKILNVVNKNIKEALKNKEVCDIANAIGAGIGTSCDASKSRYEKVILAADADIDGYHINCLLIALFVNLFPDMIKSGRLYITTPPLYCWGKDEKTFGGCNKIEEIPKNVKEFKRIKGLGEFNNEQLKYFMVDPKTRNLFRVDYPSDVDEFNRIMGSTEGKYDLLKDLNILSEGR